MFLVISISVQFFLSIILFCGGGGHGVDILEFTSIVTSYLLHSEGEFILISLHDLLDGGTSKSDLFHNEK
jgi:hypothetical protein